MAGGRMSRASGSPRLVPVALFLVWAAIAAALVLVTPPASPAWPALLLAGMLLQAGCMAGVQRWSNARLSATLAELAQRLPRQTGDSGPAPVDQVAALRLGLDSHEERIAGWLHRIAAAERDGEPSTASERMARLDDALTALETQLAELADAVGAARSPETDEGPSVVRHLERLAVAIAGQGERLARCRFLIDGITPGHDRERMVAGRTPEEPAQAASLSALLGGIEAARQRITEITQESLTTLGERHGEAADAPACLEAQVQQLSQKCVDMCKEKRDVEDSLAEEKINAARQESAKNVQMQIAHLISHDISDQTEALLLRVKKIATLWDIARRATEQLRAGAPTGWKLAGAEYTPITHLYAVIDDTMRSDNERWSAAGIRLEPLDRAIADLEVYLNADHFRAILGSLLTNAVKHGTDVAISLTIDNVALGEPEAIVSVANKVAAANIPELCDEINRQITNPKVTMRDNGEVHGGTFLLTRAAAASMAAKFRCVPGDQAIAVQFRTRARRPALQ